MERIPLEMMKQLKYIPPQWCNMSPPDHNDGMGGCWGVSGGFVYKNGEDYCKSCEFYNEKLSLTERIEI